MKWGVQPRPWHSQYHVPLVTSMRVTGLCVGFGSVAHAFFIDWILDWTVSLWK